jgi:hypothetical protein
MRVLLAKRAISQPIFKVVTSHMGPKEINPRSSYVLQVNVKACNKALLGRLAVKLWLPRLRLDLRCPPLAPISSDAGIRGHLFLPRT